MFGAGNTGAAVRRWVAVGWAGPRRWGRGAGALPEVPAAHVRRGDRAGARHRAAHAGPEHRAAAPCLPVLGSARLWQDVLGADPGPLAELREGPHPATLRGLRLVPRARARRAGLPRCDR